MELTVAGALVVGTLICNEEGNEYMMVSVYRGYIHIVPMKNRTKQEQIRAYQNIATHHENCNHKPTYQRLDNETS